MKIRFAQDHDYAAIARLHRQTIRNVNSLDYTPEQIKVWAHRTNAQRFRNSASKCHRWVATINEKIAGFCDISLNNEFWGLYVHKDFIGQGVGTKLIKIAEQKLQEQGCKKVTLQATITAKEFYKKQGYKIVKKSFHNIDNHHLPIFIMSKILPQKIT